MRGCFLRVLSPFVLTLALATVAYGQGATSSLSGSVTDGTGAIIPGADVAAKNNATAATYTAVSNDKGVFNIPSMDAGTYTVTVAVMGFKTWQLKDVKLDVGVPAQIKVTLEVGRVEETVVVTGGSDIVQTQSANIATTMSVNQISQLPLVTRNVMDAVTFLAGVNSSGSNRSSTINGLPQGAINITLDGINVQDNTLKTTDGFFSLISPRLDAIEEVTVSAATPEAANAGEGSVQISMITRSGTNRLSGSGYFYLRHPSLNSNYWFNNRDVPPDPKTGKSPKDQVKLYQPGFRLGGPIVLPGFDGHDKAFFFVNYEEFRQPLEVSRQRNILSPAAQSGIFQYTSGGVTRTVDLLALAAQNGQTSTFDPLTQSVLAQIRAATGTTGGITQLTDPNLQRYTFANSGKGVRYYPTWRVDYNVSQNNKLSSSANFQHYVSSPDTLNNADPAFPGFANTAGQYSNRLTTSTTLRSTFTKNLVNELTGGYTNSTVRFFPEISVDQFAIEEGYRLGLNACCNAATLTRASVTTSPEFRAAPTWDFHDTATWLRGSHSLSFGAAFTQIGFWINDQVKVPSVSFGIDSTDPANAMFNGTNFPNASNNNLNDARAIYAILTGHVTAFTGSAVLDENTLKYSFLGEQIRRARQRETGIFLQDSWRMRKDFTLNMGVRYEVQFPYTAQNDVLSNATLADVWGVSGVGNLFKPGTLTGQTPQFVQFKKGARAYRTDWNNVAPSMGFAWRPTADRGFLRHVLGRDGDTVLRGGYSLSYERNDMNQFLNVYDGNPGVTITGSRNLSLGNLGPMPLLLRDRSRLTPGAFTAAPSYPLTGAVTDSVEIFDPNLQVPYAESFSIGIQRAINRSTAVEVRYVGNRHFQGWTSYNYNELNILENGFLNEFQLAQQNLLSNIAAGRGNSFAYFGAGTGTVPLPIYLAYLVGSTDINNPSAYTTSQFTNNTFLNRLARRNPAPGTAAGTDLNGDAGRRANAAKAGVPANFFVANPNLLGGASVTGNGGYTRYDSMQLEVRRRMSNGLQVQGSYVYGKGITTNRLSFRAPRDEVPQNNDLRHAFKANWLYELPFGQGKPFGSNVPGWIDAIIGGWEFDGTAKVYSGDILDFGNVRLIGMTDDELQSVFKIRKDDANKVVYSLPQDIIDNTIRAFSVSATSATGYSGTPPTGRYFAPANGPDCIQVVAGDCAPLHHYVTGPMFVRLDLSAVKRVKIGGGATVEFRGEFLNALNNINFNAVAATGSAATLDQVTSAYRDPNNTQDPGGRLVQLVARLSW